MDAHICAEIDIIALQQLGDNFFGQGVTTMGDRGSKDKGKKEERKKAKLNPKEKRKLKNEKKNPTTYGGAIPK